MSEVKTARKGPITVKLSEPITWGEETIRDVTLQPIKGKHLRKLPSSPSLDDILKVASKVSGQPSAVFDEMSAEDIGKIADAVGELL